MAWTRPAFGGNLMATILCPDHRPQIGTVRPGVFKKTDPVEAKAEVIREDIHVAAEQIRTQVLELIKEAAGEKVDLEGAEIIVSGGRGVGGPEGFAPVKALADALGGVVGASRAAVDAGWIATPTRWARPARPWAPSCTSPAASPAPSSTWRACAAPTASWPSTRTPTPPSSTWPTTASWATSSRCSPPSPRKSRS